MKRRVVSFEVITRSLYFDFKHHTDFFLSKNSIGQIMTPISIVQERLGKPEDYADVFRVMGKKALPQIKIF